MIAFKLYFTFLFILIGFWGASALFATGNGKNNDKWGKIFIALTVIFGLTLTIGALVSIWTE
jgi:hypothetical protein